MKKTLIILASILCLLLAAGAVAAATGKLSLLRDRRELTSEGVKNAKEELAEIMNEGPGNDSESINDIPVYTEAGLLTDHSPFRLLLDESHEKEDSNTRMTAKEILALYPEAAVRHLEDGRMYFMYDADTGYRLFILMNDKAADRVFPAGFFVVVKDAHCCSDFAGLQIGDGIDSVEAVDSVIGIYKKQLGSWGGPQDKTTSEAMNEVGYPYTTVHYLTDGLLLIEYLANDDGELYINNMRYCEDYMVTNPKGETVNYKFDDIDLPYSSKP